MRPLVDRLLATVSPELVRARVERTRPDLISRMRRRGRDWEQYGQEVGVPLPPTLIELADAMEGICVHIDDQHGWALLTPEDSRGERRLLGELAVEFPELKSRAEMVPVFGQDGDLF